MAFSSLRHRVTLTSRILASGLGVRRLSRIYRRRLLFPFDYRPPPNCRVAFGVLFILATSCVATANDGTSEPATDDAAIVFLDDDQQPTTELLDLREGYATVQWRKLPVASIYEVANASDEVLYRGRLPQAFLSGLADGDHQFRVRAFDAAGQIVAVSPHPLRVTVRHWSHSLAYSLFTVGCSVMFALVLLLVVGTRTAKRGHEMTELAA